MSVQKKSLISQRAAVTKAIVATPETSGVVAPKVAPKVLPKKGAKLAMKLSPGLKGKVRF